MDADRRPAAGCDWDGELAVSAFAGRLGTVVSEWVLDEHVEHHCYALRDLVVPQAR